MDQKIATWIGFLVIALVILPTAWVAYNQWSDINKAYSNEINNIVGSDKEKQISSEVTSAEKKEIDAWILENNLNQYGDPEDTVYPGGTPLFNEMTGENISKYEYIIKNHPDRPWDK